MLCPFSLGREWLISWKEGLGPLTKTHTASGPPHWGAAESDRGRVLVVHAGPFGSRWMPGGRLHWHNRHVWRPCGTLAKDVRR